VVAPARALGPITDFMDRILVAYIGHIYVLTTRLLTPTPNPYGQEGDDLDIRACPVGSTF
jgi:hypothetical protein